MEERYWVRHPSLREHLGPLTKEELRARYDTETLPHDCYALPDNGESKDQRNARPDWRPVAMVLGIEPEEPPPQPPALPRPITNGDRREHLRLHTAYGGLRFLISASMVVMILGEVIFTFWLMTRMTQTVPVWSGVRGVVTTMVVGLGLHAFLDIADSHLQKTRHPREPDQRGVHS